MVKTTNLEQFVALRSALLKEKSTLEARLIKINAALAADKPAVLKAAAAPKAAPRSRRMARRVKNTMTMREAALLAVKAKPLARNEIVPAMEKVGFKFGTKNPLNSIGTLLYDGKTFKKIGKKFGPVQ